MKKSILKFGKALNKAAQKKVNGGLKLIKFECLVSSGDAQCCTPSECGNTGGILSNNSHGYGSSANCWCF